MTDGEKVGLIITIATMLFLLLMLFLGGGCDVLSIQKEVYDPKGNLKELTCIERTTLGHSEITNLKFHKDPNSIDVYVGGAEVTPEGMAELIKSVSAGCIEEFKKTFTIID